jgi:signal transduction histidine kinase
MKDIHFTVTSNPDRILVSADEEQMKRVFINLFANAVEAMSGKGDIIVTMSAEGNYVKIWVSDTGKGIPLQDMDRVFEPFFTTKDKGTGLGLAIVYSIIKKHKGEIIVESEEQKGATFYIVLPREEKGHGV